MNGYNKLSKQLKDLGFEEQVKKVDDEKEEENNNSKEEETQVGKNI